METEGLSMVGKSFSVPPLFVDRRAIPSLQCSPWPSTQPSTDLQPIESMTRPGIRSLMTVSASLTDGLSLQQQPHIVVPIAQQPSFPNRQAQLIKNTVLSSITSFSPEEEMNRPPSRGSGLEVSQIPNPPCLDLLEGSRDEYIKDGLPLYKAAIEGDWKAAKHILDKKRDLIRYAITENYETLLHVAASAKRTKAVEAFVINLVQMMEEKDLGLQTKFLDTALSLAASAGNIETAKTMVKKNPGLVNIPNENTQMPLYEAAYFARPVMVRYLYGISNKMTGEYWSDENRGFVLQKCVEAEIFDIAIKIVNDCPKLTGNKELLSEVLFALAHKTDALKGTKPLHDFGIFKSLYAVFRKKLGPSEEKNEALQLLRIIWEEVAIMPLNEIDEILQGPMRKIGKENEIALFDCPFRLPFYAVKMGNTRFLVELIRLYPDLVWKRDEKERTVFHHAIKHRQIEIYKLLYEIGGTNLILITHAEDKNGNNMLHMVAKSAKQNRFQNVSGVAFQIQRELLWFKEVEKMIPPNYKDKKNKEGKRPRDLFTKTHAELLKAGEVWMKDTSSQCMVVATLIATIVFAAAFTLPGGYNQEKGIPFFRKQPSLIIFVISDAVSLIFSSTSILIFLSILTSRYAEYDFLESLPKKLVTGLATLFLSIITMMVAFGASFFTLYDKKLEWVPITITSLCGIPVILYVILQYRLLRDVFKSAYRSRYLFKHSDKRVLYH